MPSQNPNFIKPPVFEPPEEPVSADDIRVRRSDALDKARRDGILTMKPEEGRWLGQEARLAVEAGSDAVPDIAARRAAEDASAHEAATRAELDDPTRTAV